MMLLVTSLLTLLGMIVFTSSIAMGAKILALTPPVHAGSHSHLHLMTYLGNELLSRGHDVTILIYGDMPNHSKMKEVRLPAPFDKEYFKWYNEEIQEDIPRMLQGKFSANNPKMYEPLLKDCETVLTDKDLHKKLTKEAFDLAIVDQFFQCGFPLARLIGVPYVVLECSSSISFLMDIPVPSPFSYVPVFAAHVTDEMSFTQRFKNTVMFYIINHFLNEYAVLPLNDVKEKVGVYPGISISQMKTEAEFWLINNDLSLEYPRPLLPNTAYIGGMTSSPPAPLPEDLEAYVAGAGEAGVVVVSFGSIIDLKYVPELVQKILEAVSRIPQRVIWSSKVPPPDNLPKNVRIMKWIPQNDLLGHPQTKVLVTHGGANSVFEGIYHGVPIFVIPGTMDSTDNALRLRKKGMGLYHPAPTLTPDILEQAINNLTQDPRFSKAAKKYSSVMRDQPQTARERASFWIEHVIKHGGSGRHLRVHGFDLPTYAYYNIDVYACCAAIISIVIGLVGLILKCICRCICKRGVRKQKSKQS